MTLPSEVGERWYCIRSDFRCELQADMEIRKLGIPVFFPQEFRPARQDRAAIARGQSFDRIVPLFPRYLFAAFDTAHDAWRSIPSRIGVERIFGTTPERPTPVPYGVIEAILAQCAPNGVIYPPVPTTFAGIAKGSVVELLTGPFAQFIGVCQLSEPDRIRLLLDVFGRKVEVQARHVDVRVVAA